MNFILISIFGKNSKKITFFRLKRPLATQRSGALGNQNYPELSIISNTFKRAHDRPHIRPNFPKKE